MSDETCQQMIEWDWPGAYEPVMKCGRPLDGPCGHVVGTMDGKSFDCGYPPDMHDGEFDHAYVGTCRAGHGVEVVT